MFPTQGASIKLSKTTGVKHGKTISTTHDNAGEKHKPF